jgi:hypothetical protein
MDAHTREQLIVLALGAFSLFHIAVLINVALIKV